MISVIIPYRNDLAEVIREFYKGKYEIFVIGSPHRTMMKLPVTYVKKNDMGTSLVHALNKSTGNHIAIVSANLINVRECVDKMVQKCSDKTDVIVGVRKHQSKAGKLLVNLLFPKSRVTYDPLSEVFLIKREVVKQAVLHPIGSKILLEVLAKGHYNIVVDMPIKTAGKNPFNEKYSPYSHHLLKIAWSDGEITRFVKFGLVGMCSLIINEILLWAFLKQEIFLPIASLISIEMSIISAFFFNELWTFHDRRERRTRGLVQRALKFNSASLIGLLINFVILITLSHVLGMNPLAANIIGMGTAFIWNFLAHNLWTWKILPTT